MRVSIFLLYTVAAAVAVPRRSMRIVGGNTTSVEEYPFMSNMQYGLWGIWWYQSCGGSLITTKAILSAAHCYYLDSPSSWRVVLGTSMASSGGYTYKVADLIWHPHYDSISLDNDVAIVKLQSGSILSSKVSVARIAGPSYNLPDGTITYAVGWGTLWSGGDPSEELQHVDVNVINQEICAERYASLKAQPGNENWPEITDGMLCVGVLDEGGKDACQGDSGGPLVHEKNVIVGITSWGYGCAHPQYPGVNTRVSAFTGWIVANAK
ncbi:trypsin, alkaline B-like [Zerene cesonia]|uniref:trypsin, alkaline B-like n=1 Tax=Zerene cesonia TaxID=33412 RepID=UPI0018E526F1|nr:trypsin, alkaline B-like [Zerene cesonia]